MAPRGTNGDAAIPLGTPTAGRHPAHRCRTGSEVRWDPNCSALTARIGRSIPTCDPGLVADLTWPEVKRLFVAVPPDDPTHFGVRVQAFIGSAESDLSDSFDVLVCSPRWLAEALARPKPRRRG